MKIVQEFTIKHIALSIDQHKENRRKLLKIDDEEDYEWEVLRQQNYEAIAKQMVTANLFRSLKIGKSMFERTIAYVSEDPKLAEVF
jgi:regulatory protein YycH of two-component signal transduction system YycFG